MGESDNQKTIPEVAARGVLFRNSPITVAEAEPEVLLIFRRGLWDLPKGKQEPDETIRTCARREVSEEIGCGLPNIVGSLGETYHSFKRGDRAYDKTTHWFAMRIPKEDQDHLRPQEEEQIEALEWVLLKEAQERVAFDNLKELLLRFNRWYDEWSS